MMNWFYISHFVVDIYNALLDLMMPYISDRLGLSVGMGILVLNVVYIAGNALQPIWGYLADKTNKLVFVFFGILFASIFLPMTAVAPDFYSLLFFAVMGAIGISFYHPQSMGCVLNKMGIFLMAGSFGFSIAPLLTVFISKNYGFEAIPYLSIVGVLMALSMFLFRIHKTSKKIQKKKKVSIKIILRKLKIKKLVLMSIGVGVIISSFGQIAPFLWKENGKDIAYSGTSLFFFYTAGAIGGALVEKIRKKLGRVNTFYFGFFFLWLFIMLFLLFQQFDILSLILLTGIGFISMGLVPLLITTGQQLMPMYKSSIAGIVGGFSYAIACVITVGVGFLCNYIGISSALVIVGFIPLSCCFLVKGVRVRNFFELLNPYKH